MDYMKLSLAAHRQWKGKLQVTAKAPVTNAHELSLAYTPGVAAPCLAIQKDPAESWTLTGRGNTVAVITDGTAVLGLGDIGPEAAMPVMEGKCVLFREFGGIDAIPLCVRTKDPEEFVRAVRLLCGSFGGINLEDISAPRCFAIEEALRRSCDIPVFHDDQHGTAVVALAGAVNALAVVGKQLPDCRVVISGAGAAGTAIARLLLSAGAGEVTVCDRQGILSPGRSGMNEAKAALAELTNPTGRTGSLADGAKGADLLIGVSGPGTFTEEMIASMAPSGVVFACANPTPEISPEEARAAGAAVIATGRSDLPNQLNNVLAFPGIFRGALDAGAVTINEEMKLAAAQALAAIPREDGLRADYILPLPFDPRVRDRVASAVAEAARAAHVTRKEASLG